MENHGCLGIHCIFQCFPEGGSVLENTEELSDIEGQLTQKPHKGRIHSQLSEHPKGRRPSGRVK